jgi:hypothetical protein
LLRDRAHGFSLRELAKIHRLSRTSITRALRQSAIGGAQ